eukprot:2849549-Lingulodinium_polyedra.AAC.1
MPRTGRRARAMATSTSQRRAIHPSHCRKAAGGSEEVTLAPCSKAAKWATSLPPTLSGCD